MAAWRAAVGTAAKHPLRLRRRHVERIAGVAESDTDRTNEEGKASSVQFIHFPFTPGQIGAFRAPGARVVLGFDHPNYSHMSVMPDQVRQVLARDFA